MKDSIKNQASDWLDKLEDTFGMGDDDKSNAKNQMNDSQKDVGQKGGSVNPVQVQKFLGGVNYPASKSELISHAKIEGADKDVLNNLAKMPDQQYQTPIDVSQALGDETK